MPYTLIKGEYHIWYPGNELQGPEPDGDTVKFKPDQPALVHGLEQGGGRVPDFNNRGLINLRFEAIDALETHFSEMHQNMRWANKARDEMLSKIGFSNVQFVPQNPYKVRHADPQFTRGYILARSLDTYGRAIAFVFAGEPAINATSVYLEPALAAQSVNGQLLAEGLVYPTFYSTLPVALRDYFRVLARTARTNSLGLWPHDTVSTSKWGDVADLAALQNLVIWPKLFRRLSKYLASGFANLNQFDAWLRLDEVNRDDSLFFLRNSELANMHDLIEIDGNRMKMTELPEDIVIEPDPVQSGGVAAGAGTGAVRPRDYSVRIIAVYPNPPGGQERDERVTLINYGPADVNLNGWKLQDRAGQTKNLGGTIRQAETRAILSKPEISLNNSGDTVRLLDANGNLVDEVAYSATQGAREGWSVVFG